MHSQAEHLVQLPPELRGQFAVLERRLWRVDTIIAVAGSISGLVVSYALQFISDRFWDTPIWLRLAITALGLALVVYFTYSWVKLWVLSKRDTRALANIVQKSHRRLGDRLLGIVELANESTRPANVSAGLCRAAIAQVSSEALKFDFRLAVATRKPKIYSLIAVVLLLLILTPCVLVPDAGANAFARWIWPVSATPRYTFVTLSALPEKLIVAHGEPFEVECGLIVRSKIRPKEAAFQYDRQVPITFPVTGDKVIFKIPPQTQPGKLRLSVGDDQRTVQVEPTYRPALRKLTAHVQVPPYLHYPDLDGEVKNGRYTAVEGSKLTLTANATRRLASAAMVGDKLVPLPVKGDEFTTPAFTLSGDVKLRLTWRDELGLEVKAPALLTLAAQRDNPPQVEFPDLARAVAVLEDEVLAIRVTSQDDYGVKNIGVRLDIALPAKPDEVATRVFEVKAGGYQMKKLDGKYDFSPLVLQLPPGTLVGLRATALDYLPDRQPSESIMHRIFVMSKEEHAKMVQEEFEKLRAALEELTRRQENLAGDTKQVKDLKPEQLANEETAKQLGEQANEQQDYAQQLERLAQDTLKNTKEALRNKSIPTDIVKDWTENVEKMQDIARQKMQPASQSLKNAQAKQSPQERKEKTDEGLQQEQEALQNMQDLLKKMATTMDKMQAKSLADRLRALGQVEKETGDELQKSLPETIGLTKDQLPPVVRKNFDRLSGDQEKTSKQVKRVQDEIQRFFQRTGIERHGEVHKDMEEVKAIEGVAQVGDLIKENIGSQAMAQSKQLAGKFFQWAEKLDGEKKDDDGGGGGGGGDKKMSEEDLEKMLALLRIRETQETLREQTRLMEQLRKGKENYAQDTAKLADRQQGASKELKRLKKDRLFDKPRERMNDANEAMDDAASHLKRPRTDDPAYNAQSDAMNLLDEAIKQMMPDSKQGKGQGQQQGMMAFMQMLAMGQGKPQMGEGKDPNAQSPGGNTGNYGSERPNTPYTGDVRGKTGGARKVDKGSAGGSGRVLPSEYREALQNYFNAVEKVN
ncbi:MAG: hypothetical protein WCO56_11140 [Verrucomicrobiota bacterium]